jgi:hypothetical protein
MAAPQTIPRSKPDSAERTAKQPVQTKAKQSPFTSSVGVWTGSPTGDIRMNGGLNASSPQMLTVRISHDGVVSSPQEGYTSSIKGDSRNATWNIQKNEPQGSIRGTASLHLVTPNTANLRQDAVLVSGSGQ